MTHDPALSRAVTVLAVLGANIGDQLHRAGFTEQPHIRQTLALAEEVGELVGAVRRHYGMARRTGPFSDVEEELADVIITAFVTADALGVDITKAVLAKVDRIYTRGWREPAPPDGAEQ